ncbi:transmembrane and coiled-coil domains protein 1-like isoform X2 [Amphiura filiformis]|uniref:transmembrane and coiled-coil domains protein 1-like isoform X2 n=1 Tax=Amphiura filiformis TaxID=82378 RepID=UPI003B222756
MLQVPIWATPPARNRSKSMGVIRILEHLKSYKDTSKCEKEDEYQRDRRSASFCVIEDEPPIRRLSRSAENLTTGTERLTSTPIHGRASPPAPKLTLGFKGFFTRKKEGEISGSDISASPLSASDTHPVSYADNIYNPPERPRAFNRVLQQIRSKPAMSRSDGKVSSSSSLSKPSAVRTASDGTSSDNEVPAIKETKDDSNRPVRSRTPLPFVVNKDKDTDRSIQYDSDLGEPLGSLPSMQYGSDNDPLDETDSGSTTIDPTRTRHHIEETLRKIERTKELIKAEQKVKDDNVTEYLALAEHADKVQILRIKQVFEKKNQKSNQTMAHLQKKLEAYHKRLVELEINGYVGPKKPKEVLHGMSLGLKGVRDNIKEGITGLSGAVIAKPKDLANKVKTKLGSVDNIDNTDEDDDSDHHPRSDHHHHQHQHHREQNKSRTSWYTPMPEKLDGEETSSIATSSSIANGVFHVGRVEDDDADHNHHHHPLASTVNLLQATMQEVTATNSRLQKTIEELKDQLQNQYQYFNQAIQEERYRAERLEEQLADLSELHHHSLNNVQQELSGIEERLEYRSEERARDLQDSIEQCATRVSKIELAQQHREVITLEGYQSANAKALLSKLINVVLAVLAVLLVIISTANNAISPFLSSRGRFITTLVICVVLVIVWQRRELLEDITRSFVENFQSIFYVRTG